MHAPTPRSGRFALLVDCDPATRSIIGPALPDGLQLVQSRTGSAALALLQRMAEHFGLALVTLDLEDMPGRVVIDTIRLFRPEIPVICLSRSQGVKAETGVQCLAKEGDGTALRVRLQEMWKTLGTSWPLPGATAAAIEQARTTFALTGDLTLAARELLRGEPSEPRGGLS